MSFAPNGGLPTGLGGSPLGALTPIGSALGGHGGSLTSGVAGQLGSLAGLARHVDPVQPAMQLAQTGFSLMDKTPGAVAEAINGAGSPAHLTQLNRYVTLDTPPGPDVLPVSAVVVDEHVNRMPEIHLDLLSRRHDLPPEELIDQQARRSTLVRRSSWVNRLSLLLSAVACTVITGCSAVDSQTLEQRPDPTARYLIWAQGDKPTRTLYFAQRVIDALSSNPVRHVDLMIVYEAPKEPYSVVRQLLVNCTTGQYSELANATIYRDGRTSRIVERGNHPLVPQFAKFSCGPVGELTLDNGFVKMGPLLDNQLINWAWMYPWKDGQRPPEAKATPEQAAQMLKKLDEVDKAAFKTYDKERQDVIEKSGEIAKLGTRPPGMSNQINHGPPHPCGGPGPGEVVVGQMPATNGVGAIALCMSQ
ncbi:hypothetical protein GQ57_20275 [Burkholderia sp. MSh2]|uniref:Type VI secretion protein n=1 Tax=Burkholderia paludis TaxID=1506587 RepID=A0A6J5E0T9_9BURK|nr:hypothetical protein GQ57_20275 [Burkholderia sp. MSh2]CAB3759081.1 hypothetical protein LMG30113_03357 [Burkholderia paludis]VWB52963.1 type VI secretion protein [Burkholderia paludis]